MALILDELQLPTRIRIKGGLNVNKLPETAIRPLNEYVLVEPDPREESSNGIYVPYMSQRPYETGTVLAVGPGRLHKSGSRLSINLKRGDRIRFRSYRGVELREEGLYLIFLKDDEIFGVEE